MALRKYTDQASSLLASGIGTGDTSITVSTGDGAEFPALTGGDEFALTIYTGSAVAPTAFENVVATARSGDVITITRGQDGTSAQVWSAGAKVALFSRASDFANFLRADGSLAMAGTLSASSGTETLLDVDPTVNQSGTAGYTAVQINATETATGSGSKLLLDAQVGGASKLSVSNTGAITAAANTDATFALGQTLIDSRGANGTYVSNDAWPGANDYAFRQTAGGTTFVNAPTGVDVRIMNTNVGLAYFQAGGIGFGATPGAGARFHVTTTGKPNAFRINDATGHIGIGTAAGSTTALHVATAGKVDALRVNNTTGAVGLGAAAATGAAFHVTTAGKANALRVNDSTGAVGVGAAAATGDAFHVTTTGKASALRVNESTGAVGVGATAASGAAFHVTTTGKPNAFRINDATGHIGIGTAAGSTTALHVATAGKVDALRVNNTTGAVGLGAAAATGAAFHVTTAGKANALRVNEATGHVGVGATPAAGSAFHVTTTGKANAFRVNNTTGAVGVGAAAGSGAAFHVTTTGRADALRVNDSSGGVGIGAAVGAGENFRVWSTGDADALVVLDTSEVGVGRIPSTGRKFHVSTAAHSSALYVEDSTGYTQVSVRLTYAGSGNNYHEGGGSTLLLSCDTQINLQHNGDSTMDGVFMFDGGSGDQMQATSGNQAFMRLEPSVNTSGTAGYTAIRVNATETGLGSGANYLLDAQVGGTSRLRVTTDGATTLVQRNTAGAVAVLTLDQDDVDEEFIEFAGTTGADTTSSISTHGTAGTIQGWVQVTINGTKRWVPFYDDPSA